MMMMIKHDKKLHTSKSPGKRNTCKNRSENRGRRSPKNIDIFWRIRWLDVDDFFPAGSLAARRISKFDHIHRRCVFASCKSVRKHGRHTKRYMAWRIQVNGMVTYIHGTTRPLGDLLTMVVKKPRIQVLGWSSSKVPRPPKTKKTLQHTCVLGVRELPERIEMTHLTVKPPIQVVGNSNIFNFEPPRFPGGGKWWITFQKGILFSNGLVDWTTN